MTQDIPGSKKLTGFKKGLDIYEDAYVPMSA